MFTAISASNVYAKEWKEKKRKVDREVSHTLNELASAPELQATAVL